MIWNGIEVSIVAFHDLLARPRGELNDGPKAYVPTTRREKLGIRMRLTPDYVPKGDETALMFRLSYWKDDPKRQSFEHLTESLSYWLTGSDMTFGPFVAAPRDSTSGQEFSVYIQQGHIINGYFEALEPGARPWDHNPPDFLFSIHNHKFFSEARDVEWAYSEHELRQAFLPIQNITKEANQADRKHHSTRNTEQDRRSDSSGTISEKEVQRSILELAVEEVALRRQLLELDL